MKIWIVILNYNGLDDTCRCLESILALDDPSVSTVVVDNASTVDPRASLRREFAWCTVVRNRENGGWAGGNNVGIRWALEHGAEQVVLLNNDTIVAPELCRALQQAAAANPSFGVIGPMINYMDEPDIVMTDGCRFNTPSEPGFFHRQPVASASAESLKLTEVDIVNGCCMMIAARVFARIGLIDERFFLVHEESDFCLRARRAGFRSGVFGRTLVWHKGSSSFERNGRQLQRYYDSRNLLLLLSKHRGGARPARGICRSRLEYIKYVYYRYAIARETGHAAVADAILQGVYDALVGKYGAFQPAPRPGLSWVRTVFDSFYRHRHPAASSGSSPADAAALH